MPKKIKIAYVIDELGIGGTERQLKYLIDGLDRSIFEPVLYLLRNKVDNSMRPFNTPIELLGVTSLFSLNGLIKFIAFAWGLKKYKFDIVQTFFQDSTIFGVIAARLAGVRKVVVSVRDLLFWKTPLISWVHRKITARADFIIVNSNAIKEHLTGNYYFNKINVIHNGIPVENALTASLESKNSLCSGLGIDPRFPIVTLVANCNRAVKRVDLLVEAAPLVLKGKKVFFLIVGNGHLLPELQKRASELGIQCWVKFLGSRNDTEKILAGSDLALNTSDSEGLSNSVLEAMRAGIPVVVSDVAGNRELVESEKTGLFFHPGDPQSLAFQIQTILNDTEFSNRLGCSGKLEFEKNYSLSRMVSEHITLYTSIA